MYATARWLPASGLLAAVAFGLTGVISPPPPVAGAPTAEVVAYYAGHHLDLEIESLIDAIGATLLVVFAATLHARIGSSASIAGFGAACIVSACTLVQVAAFETHAFRPVSDPSTAAVLNDFQTFAFEVTTFPALVFLAATAVAILESGSLPNWIGIGAAAAAALQAVAWISFFEQSGPLAAGGVPDIISFVALLAWLSGCSLFICVEAWRRRHSPPTQPRAH